MPSDISRFLGLLVSPRKPRSIVARYAVAVLLPVVCIGVAHVLFTLDRAPFFPLFTISVVVAAVYGGMRAGFVATAVSVLVNALALPPHFSIQIADSESLLRVIIFALGGIFVSLFIGGIAGLQQKLAVERERLRVTLTSIGDAVIATDANGCITFMNAVAESATGWSIAEATGKPLEEVFQILNEQTGARVENPIRKVFQCGAVVGLANHTVLLRRDGSEIAIDDSAAPIRDAQNHIAGAVLVFRDISEQRKKDATLLQSEKLASVGRMAATIAHEINNPLEAVSNLLYLIGSAQDLTTAQQYAAVAHEELDRAAHVTKQTLSFARRSDRREAVEFAPLIDGVLSLYGNKVRSKNIEVVKEYEPDAIAEATTSEVRQVIGNLIGNALDAMPQGGRLRLRLRRSQCGGRPTLRFVVADSGGGIAKEHRSKVFEPFFTTKDDVGTGLGLWVTKQIVEAHTGCIHLRSRVGHGTVVSVCWPITAVNSVEIARPPMTEPPQTLRAHDDVA